MGNSRDKPKGWHSRRHKTGDAQREAREAFQNRVNPNRDPGPKNKREDNNS